MKICRVVRGNTAYRVQGGAEGLQYTCDQQGWEFDSIEDVRDNGFNREWCKVWKIGELIDQIGTHALPAERESAEAREAEPDLPIGGASG